MPVAPPCVRTEIAMCDYDNEDHPARNCFAKMSPKIQESVKADCGLYLETDKFDVFQRNIDIICNAKGYPIEKDCYNLMSYQIQKSLKEDCLSYILGSSAMNDFTENIKVLCDAKKSKIRPMELPTTSPPTFDCYNLMSYQIQKSLKEDCLSYIGSSAMNDFTENIKVLCDAKKSKIRPMELPTSFVVCLLENVSFDNNRQFILIFVIFYLFQDCYNLMSYQIQKSVKEDCLSYILGSSAMNDFTQNIKVLCEAKKSKIQPMELPTTSPPTFENLCDFDSEDHPIHECYSLMSSQIQTSLKADCVAYEGTPELDNLGENIQLLCEAKKSKIKPKKFSLREYYNT
ncbi:hypothetical protein LSH36_42g09127, partial [Paralvinella palmiformis]